MTAANTEASRIASFEVASSDAAGNARPAMKMAMVNPIPPTSPTTQTPIHDTPLGRAEMPSLTEAKLAATMPSGFPTTSPKMTPRVTVVKPGLRDVEATYVDAGIRQGKQRHDRRKPPKGAALPGF